MRAGTDRYTGAILTGWPHCAQCIAVVLSTEIGWRVMLREFGSGARGLQDRNMTPQRIMQIYALIASALDRWEPGFQLRRLRVLSATSDGVLKLDLAGAFFPNGHLGDFSVVEERQALFAANDNGIFVAEQAA